MLNLAIINPRVVIPKFKDPFLARIQSRNDQIYEDILVAKIREMQLGVEQKKVDFQTAKDDGEAIGYKKGARTWQSRG